MRRVRPHTNPVSKNPRTKKQSLRHAQELRQREIARRLKRGATYINWLVQAELRGDDDLAPVAVSVGTRYRAAQRGLPGVFSLGNQQSRTKERFLCDFIIGYT